MVAPTEQELMSELSEETALSTSLLSHLARGQARPKIVVSTRPGHRHQEKILKIVPPATLGQPPSWRHAGKHTTCHPHDFLYLPLSPSFITTSAPHIVCRKILVLTLHDMECEGEQPFRYISLLLWLLWQAGLMEREVLRSCAPLSLTYFCTLMRISLMLLTLGDPMQIPQRQRLVYFAIGPRPRLTRISSNSRSIFNADINRGSTECPSWVTSFFVLFTCFFSR